MSIVCPSKKLFYTCHERRQSKAPSSDKIVGNDFEPLEAGPEEASPKDGASHHRLQNGFQPRVRNPLFFCSTLTAWASIAK